MSELIRPKLLPRKSPKFHRKSGQPRSQERVWHREVAQNSKGINEKALWNTVPRNALVIKF